MTVEADDLGLIGLNESQKDLIGKARDKFSESNDQLNTFLQCMFDSEDGLRTAVEIAETDHDKAELLLIRWSPA